MEQNDKVSRVASDPPTSDFEEHHLLTKKRSISVVIPTFRRPAIVLEALASVGAQTLQPSQTILVESPSDFPLSDEKIPTNVELRNAPTRLLPGDARNYGAQIASGDYLAFLDDDDLWDPSYLEFISQAITANEAHHRQLDVLYGQLFDEDGRSVRSRHFPDPSAALWVNPGITGSNLVIRREFFDFIGGFDGTMSPSEDREILIRAVAETDAIQYVPSARAQIRSVSESRISTYFFRGNVRLIRMHRGKMRKSDLLLAWLFVALRLVVSLNLKRHVLKLIRSFNLSKVSKVRSSSTPSRD